MESTASFGQWVRVRRTALHLTRGDLARRTDCSEIMLRKIEADERRPSPVIARRLAAQLQLAADLVPRFLKVACGDLSPEHLPWLDGGNQRPRHWLPVLSRADLAVPVTSFLGRTQEIAQICDRLQQPALRLLTLVGPPGIGKSRLSLHVAAALGDAFLNGAHFVPLAPLRNPDLVLDAVAQIFGFAESAYPTPLDYLRAELCHRHLLIVLDNFEQVLPAGRILQELLIAAPAVKFLVTSRVSLGVPGEEVFVVPALGVPPTAHATSALGVLRFPAVQLLIARGRIANPAFTLTSHNAAAVAAICARMDGLPLAIELVAAHLESLTPDDLLAQLANRLELAANSKADRPERHHTLYSAIAWSYDLLPPPAQKVFARLGVFVHGATLEMVNAVCQAVGDLSGSLQPQLDLLVSHNLVRAEQDAIGATRYTMLETVLDFARELLADRGELAALRQAHVVSFCAFIEAAAPNIHSREKDAWIARIEQDIDNLRAALAWARAADEVAVLARLVAALGWFWEFQGRRVEARGWLETVLAIPAAEHPPAARAKLLQMADFIASEQSEWERSRQFAEESLALATALGDRWTSALCQVDLSSVYYVVDNDLELALTTCLAAATTLNELGDLQNYLWALTGMAHICRSAGDPARGLPYANEALRLAREWGDKACVHAAVDTLALLILAAGDFERGLQLMAEGLRLAAELPNGKQLAWQHYHMADALLDHADAQRAAVHYAESARLWLDRGETLTAAYCRSGLANCLLRQGDLRRANALYLDTLVVYRQFDEPRCVAWTLYNLAFVMRATGGEPGHVEALLDESLACFARVHPERSGAAAIHAALAGDWAAPREPIRL
ncbi:MAG TPA: hypothetical protein P5148_06685 [Anaerolineae bacterium]|nr:hypothetical protein [Anaerolineae bacterium]